MQPSNVMIFIITLPTLYFGRSQHPHFCSDQAQERVQSMWKMLKYGMIVIQDREPDISLVFEWLIATKSTPCVMWNFASLIVVWLIW